MRILALDISKAGTGVAIGDATDPPRSFVASFTGATRGHVWWNFGIWLREQLAVEKPDLVAFEAPIYGRKIKSSAPTTILLRGLASVTEMLCAPRVRCVSVPTSTWRKHFLGHGFPHDPKQAALNQCALLGWDVGGSHDRAEACGVFAWAHFNHGDRREIKLALSASSVRAMA